MADKRDYYEVLGVDKGASDAQIKKAYRKLAKENHPDLHPGDTACEARFKEIGEAYAVLSDPEKRSKYDQFGHDAFDPNSMGGAGFGDFGDIFSDIFGAFTGGGRSSRNPNAPTRGESIRTGVTISFEEAAFGCEKEISIARVEACSDCGGSGAAKGTTPEICPDCHGTGTIRQQQRSPFGVISTQGPCPKCNGTGRIIHQPCQTCRGKGAVRKQRKIKANIPAGIDNGQTIRLPGLGNAGKNGGPQGDLLLTIGIRNHPKFQRDGYSVLYEQPISFTQAALGCDIQVPTLDGNMSLTIPEGTQSSTVFRMRGLGITHLHGKGRGDQYVTVRVVTPENLGTAQKNILREFAMAMGEIPISEKDGPLKRKKKKK